MGSDHTFWPGSIECRTYALMRHDSFMFSGYTKYRGHVSTAISILFYRLRQNLSLALCFARIWVYETCAQTPKSPKGACFIIPFITGYWVPNFLRVIHEVFYLMSAKHPITKRLTGSVIVNTIWRWRNCPKRLQMARVLYSPIRPSERHNSLE